MKILSGIVKKVLTDDQYDLISKNMIDPKEIKFEETLRMKESETEDEPVFYLPFRISYREVDSNGNDKYIFDESCEEYKKLYKTSQVIYAYNKEMRILLELGEYAPVKICVEPVELEDRTILRLICVQNQHSGLLSS